MPLPQSVKAKDILDWFAALAIPVCDDEALINRKFEGLKARYTADLNKPGDASRVARDWFKHVNLLQKERAAALDLVYTGMYQVTADLTIALAVGSGATVLTSQVRDGLLDVARKQCSTDDALAHRYVDRFIKDRNFTGGSLPRIQPASIANFIVTPKLGRIQLAWDWPANNCKDIRVIREEVIGRKNRKESVFTHGITQHADTDLVPGVWYQYKACARLPDHNGVDIYGSESESRAPAMAEVEQLNAAVQAAGGILLSWRPPASDVTVHIFQSYSGAPAIRTTADGPEAIAPARRLGVTGASTYADNDVKEGTVSHYRLVADFGREVYTEGKVVSVTVPVPPLPPREVMATYRFNADKDEVTISWKSVAGRGEAYTVVRRNGATPPTREDDGQVVLNKGAQEQFTDATASSGTCYTYAVFTYSGSMRSRSATASTPVVVRSDVTGLQAMAGNSRVELKWNSPAKFEKVIVRRRHDGLPRHVNDGLDVPVMARGSARDEPLRNGLRHSYLICCAYLGPDGRSLVYSEGKTIEAVPDVNPEPGQNLRVEVKGSEIWCVWDAARVGHDFIRRSASPPTMVEGVLFPQGGLPAGTEAGIDDRGRGTDGRRLAIDRKPDAAKPFYTVYTTSGGSAVRGPTARLILIPDVSALTVTRQFDEVILRWTWPPNCTEVLIARAENTWPRSHDDPQATVRSLTLGDYEKSGSKYVEVILGKQDARYCYAVYAVLHNPSGRSVSAGTDPGSRAIAASINWMTLTYNLGGGGTGAAKAGRLRLSWNSRKSLKDFGGFVIVASDTKIPDTREGGTELYRCPPGALQGDGDYDDSVSLAPVHAAGWKHFRCKLFLLEPSQESRVLVIHPDTCVTYTRDGVEETFSAPALPRMYRQGIPSTVICPDGLEEFVVRELQFSFEEGGPRQAGGYSFMDRLFGPDTLLGRLMKRRRRLKPPRRAGRMAGYKYCPNGHRLHRTAGSQPSLTLGLIGARSSGKSSYVATLIKQVQDRVMVEYAAAMLPANTATVERYGRDFHDPLFKYRTVLAVTPPGMPAPLIYDLEVGDGRAANLVLYDTAGEDLQNAETADKTVKYLRVAAGVIFLIDPLQIEGVRAELKGRGASIPGEIDAAATPSAIIGSVLGLLETHNAVGQNAPVATPVAIVLSKCDALREHGLLGNNRLWSLEDKRHKQEYNSRWHEDMSGMIGEFLLKWDSGTYSNISRRFPNRAFFGMSATGCAAVAGRYKYISPFRVEDPLLWLLSQIGILPSAGGGTNGEHR